MLLVRSFALLVSGFLLFAAPLYIRAQQRSQTPGARQPAPQPTPAPQQTPGSREGTAPGSGSGPQEQRSWRAQVSNDIPPTISLRARETPLTEIAAELGNRLRATMQLSPLMQRQRITVQFSDLPLETALRLLAPQVFIDYEIRSDVSALPKPLGVYLYAANEAPPPLNAVVRNSAQAILIEGHTDEGVDDAPEQDRPLRVDYANGRLSVRARQQPVTAVLFEIASKMGIPFEMRGDASNPITLEMNEASLEEVIRALSPNILLYARADLQTAQNQPIRLVLLPAARQ